MSEMNTVRVREIEECQEYGFNDDWDQAHECVDELIAALKEMASVTLEVIPLCDGECDCKVCDLRKRYEGLVEESIPESGAPSLVEFKDPITGEVLWRIARR